jgi:CO/xanthine dehydrogenase Mo-binding subunit
MSSPEVVGVSVPQVNAREKVLGRAQYVADIKMGGMLHAKVLRSPYAHARIVSIDASRARALRGVKLVVTGEDTPTCLWGVIRKEHRILASEKVRFVGEEVAAVVATDEATALDAIELIRVEYEELPALLTPAAALVEGAPELHPGTANVASDLRIARGDVEVGFRDSAAVYEAEYEVGYQYHGYMEPMGTVAAPGSDGKVTVWTPAQMIFVSRARIAEALGVEPSKVRVIQTVTGGGFGGKTGEDANAPITAYLALKAGRPVRLVNNRLEDFQAARASLPAKIWLKMGIAKDGRLLAKDAIITADNGAYSGCTSKMVQVTAMRIDNMMRIEHVRAHARLVFTNNLPSGTFRGFGGQQMAFPVNSHIHMLAEMIGMDPAEVHLRNAIRTGETSVHGWKIGSSGLTECIERACDGTRWKEKYGRRLSPERAKRRGVGLGCGIHVSGNRQIFNWDGATVFVKVEEDGRVLVVTGESDIGQGSNTVLTQIVAQELGVPVGSISVTTPDTDLSPFGLGSMASRVTILAGNAALQAAREAREKLLAMASDALEVAASDLTIEGGRIHVVGLPQKGMSVAEASRMHIFRTGGEGIYTKATYDPPTEASDSEFYGNIAPAYSFTAQVFEVEVDTDTGKVRVVDGVCADDCGKALNPRAIEGQTFGAVAQGIGSALFEGYVVEGGRLLNGNFADYNLPTADSLPMLRSELVESNDPNGPYGAKGASETAIVPTAGAIANAIYDAVGVRINSLPITPEKILAGLREKAKRA